MLDWSKVFDSIKELAGARFYISTTSNKLLSDFFKTFKDILNLDVLNDGNVREVLLGNTDGVLLFDKDFFQTAGKSISQICIINCLNLKQLKIKAKSSCVKAESKF